MATRAHTRTEVRAGAGRPIVLRSAIDDEGAEVLASEADRLTRARHPGVVELREVTPDGLVLEWAGTETLATARLDVSAAAAVLSAVSRTVADLHGLGIVHGRIEPSHVVIDPDGRPRLCGLRGRGPDEAPAGPADDVAAVGALIDHLVGPEAEMEPIPDRRWARRRWSGFQRRSLQTIADAATDPDPARRPTANALARAIAEAVPDARLPSTDDTTVGRVSAASDDRFEPTDEEVGALEDGNTFAPTMRPDDDLDDDAPVAAAPSFTPLPPPRTFAAAAAHGPSTTTAADGDGDASSITGIGPYEHASDPLSLQNGAARHDEGSSTHLRGPDRPPDDLDHRVRGAVPRVGHRRDARAVALLLAAAALVAAVLLLRQPERSVASPEATPTATEPPTAAPSTPLGDTTAKTEPRANARCAGAEAGGADLDGDGCADPYVIDGTTIRALGRTFRAGAAGDMVRIGDWDCDGRSTPAVLRPSTGEVFLFASWELTAGSKTIGALDVVPGVVSLRPGDPPACVPVAVTGDGREVPLDLGGEGR